MGLSVLRELKVLAKAVALGFNPSSASVASNRSPNIELSEEVILGFISKESTGDCLLRQHQTDELGLELRFRDDWVETVVPSAKPYRSILYCKHPGNKRCFANAWRFNFDPRKARRMDLDAHSVAKGRVC